MTRIVWGYPGHELFEAEQRGQVKLGGCCLPAFRAEFWCPACETGRGFTCPVCGCRYLPDAPWDGEMPSTTPCPCCGTRFGVDTAEPWDSERHRELRQRWVEGGCHWVSTQIQPPRRQTPQAQLRRVEGL